MDPSENLTWEVRSGNLEEVRKLISKYGLSHRREWSNGYTLLRDAVENGQMEVAKFLLANGCNVKSKRSLTVPSKTVLHFAAVHGNLEIVKTLLEKGAYVNVSDKDGNTPLHEAVKRKDVDTTALLVEYGAHVNTSNKNGETPLHAASEKGLIRNAEYQLKHGANANSRWNNSKNDNTPLCSAEDGYERIVNILLDKGAYVNITDKNENTPLHVAVQRSEVGTTVLLVKYGANVNARNKIGEMPLHVASEKGHIWNVQHLLEHGAYVNSVCNKKFKEGYTPLHFAAENGYDAIVDLLLNKDASVNAIAKGCTPLHFAAERGHANITKSLLKHGADANCMCTANYSEGYSPLHFAVEKGHWKAARILLECGANVDAQNKSGHTILHEAVSVAKTSMVELVLEYCPDVNNESNRSSLNLALNGSPLLYREIIELLLQNGFNIRDEADLNAVSRYCKSSIQAAALNGNVTVLEALLEHGASANSKDENGQTPLYAAAYKGNLQVIETLLKYGADIDSRDQCGRTALHIASWMGHASIVRGLLDYGSDINIADSWKSTALDFAEKAKYESFRKAHLNDSDNDSLCFQDDYDDDGFSPLDYLHEILEYHIIKLKTANLPVSHKNLRSIKYNQTMQDFEDECKNEFQTLRQNFVGNTKHSFHRLLTKNDHHLAIILEDDNVSRCIKPDHIKEKFPLYGSIVHACKRKPKAL